MCPECFFTFAGTILNSVVIMSLWNSQLRRKLCYFVIFIQACFDLAVVAVIHPYIILQIISGWMNMNFDSSISVDCLYILVDCSYAALLTMTLERCLALVYPFFSSEIRDNIKIDSSFHAIPVAVWSAMRIAQ